MLNYEIIGSGKPVVFLHGFLESNNMWDYLSDMKGIQQIRIELPGHGKSPDPLDTESLEIVAESIITLLDKINIDKYDIVGHSMGGYVGLELKSKDPRANKLVLLNSNFWNDSPSKKNDRERIARIVRRSKEVFIYEAIPNLFLYPEKNDLAVKKMIEEALQISSTAIASVSLAMSRRKNHTKFVSEHKNEILVLQGAEDNIVDLDQMLKAAKKTGCKFEKLEQCGHMGHIEQTERVVNQITSFLT